MLLTQKYLLSGRDVLYVSLLRLIVDKLKMSYKHPTEKLLSYDDLLSILGCETTLQDLDAAIGIEKIEYLSIIMAELKYL